MENLFTADCIRTFSGKYVNIFSPTPEMFCIEDIAHALSYQCRFGGHLPNFYSVAQHSIFCANFISKQHKFSALMHDASEAYLLDIPTPIKKHLAGYKDIENKLMEMLADIFKFDWPLNESIKSVDSLALQYEWDYYMLGKKEVDGLPLKTNILTSEEAEKEFLQLFNQLKP